MPTHKHSGATGSPVTSSASSRDATPKSARAWNVKQPPPSGAVLAPVRACACVRPAMEVMGRAIGRAPTDVAVVALGGFVRPGMWA